MKLRLSWNMRRTVGLAMGILLPLVCIPLVIALLSWAQNFYFAQLWSAFTHNVDTQSKLISLSIIPNLGIFFLFLNKERYDIARGIILGSGLYLPYIIYLKFF